MSQTAYKDKSIVESDEIADVGNGVLIPRYTPEEYAEERQKRHTALATSAKNISTATTQEIVGASQWQHMKKK
jgi:hypothetical protein